MPFEGRVLFPEDEPDRDPRGDEPRPSPEDEFSPELGDLARRLSAQAEGLASAYPPGVAERPRPTVSAEESAAPGRRGLVGLTMSLALTIVAVGLVWKRPAEDPVRPVADAPVTEAPVTETPVTEGLAAMEAKLENPPVARENPATPVEVLMRLDPGLREAAFDLEEQGSLRPRIEI